MKGTGSRGVPHRLNQNERVIFDYACKKGFVEIDGSGWRKQRRDAPLGNTYRSYCDARAQPVVAILKDKEGIDAVFVDLSPLRSPPMATSAGMVDGIVREDFSTIASSCHSAMAELGFADEAVRVGEEEQALSEQRVGEDDDGSEDESSTIVVQCSAEDWLKLPIYRLPVYGLEWRLPRPDAKRLAKSLSQYFQTGAEAPKKKQQQQRKVRKSKSKPSRKLDMHVSRYDFADGEYTDGDDEEEGGYLDHEGSWLGMRDRRCGVKRSKIPQVKPGKGRRSGGYGIG